MKILRLLLPLLLVVSTLRAAAPPRFYVIGQIGAFAADAGTPTVNGPYVDRGIKSGTKTFSDWSVGAEFLNWLSLEAGYVDFASFSSDVFDYDPDIRFIMTPPATWQAYDLHGFRLTPVLNVFSTDRVTLKLLGGLMRSTGKVTSFSVYMDKRFPDYKRSGDLDDVGYHIGVGVACNLTKQATLEGRIVRYDFGKPERDANRITALTYSLGLSWRF